MISAILILAIIGSISASPMSANHRRGYHLPSFYTYDSYPSYPGYPSMVGRQPYRVPDHGYLPPIHKRVAKVDFVAAGDSGVSGSVTLEQAGNGRVKIRGLLHGLKAGKHGFHVHQEGNLGNGCKNAKGHFNPFKKNHGAPTDSDRHVGDLGNIVTTGYGPTHVLISDTEISLDPQSEAFVGDRAIVIHGGEDDLGRGGNPESLKTGNAGPRVACGVIKVRY